MIDQSKFSMATEDERRDNEKTRMKDGENPLDVLTNTDFPEDYEAFVDELTDTLP